MSGQSKLSWQKTLRGADLTHAEFRILMIISTYTNAALENAFPSLSQIVHDCRVDPKTARAALKSLQSKGYLKLTRAGGNQHGKGLANVYAVTTPDVGRVPTIPAKGTNDSREGYQSVVPLQIMDQIINHSAVAGPASPDAPGFEDLSKDFDLFESWLIDNLMYMDESEFATVEGMWQADAHPRAILNKINADRKAERLQVFGGVS